MKASEDYLPCSIMSTILVPDKYIASTVPHLMLIKGTYFVTVDIKDYFLATSIKNLEYIQVKYHHILEDIR